MICALTVRKLKPGTFEDFRRDFMEGGAGAPPGLIRFDMLRNADAPDEVICCGFFDGTVDDLRRGAKEHGYEEQLERIAPYVESVGADGLYDVVEERVATPAQS